MAKNALTIVQRTGGITPEDEKPSRAHVHVHVREALQMPALVEPGHAVVIPPGASLPMPLPEARAVMTNTFAQLDALEEQISELNRAKSDLFKNLRDLGFDVGIVRRLRKETRLDPTLRQVNADLLRLYETLLNPNAAGE